MLGRVNRRFQPGCISALPVKSKQMGGRQLRHTQRRDAPLQVPLHVHTFTVFVGSGVKVDPKPLLRISLVWSFL